MHCFLGRFRRQLGAMPAKPTAQQLPSGLDDTKNAALGRPSNGESGFIFINNYQRVEQLPAHEDCGCIWNCPIGRRSIFRGNRGRFPRDADGHLAV